MSKRTGANRYPGIRSFERGDQGIFFGRDGEIAALFDAVKVKPLTVLFAKSGIGKTSLLNAGLIPLLEQDGFLPVNIRLQDTGLSPVDTVKKVLEPYLDQSKLKQFGHAPHSLWDYTRSCNFEGETPALIFDQFEEFFSHDKKRRDELTLALADFVNERLPDPVRERFREYPREQRTEEVLEWFNPLKIKVVFAIRADRMSDLDELKYHIPTVLHDRFHLKPLSYENARAAIEQPAALENDRFLTPPFRYETQAVQTMLEALDNEQGEIESFQLQLLCGYLENKVAGKKGKNLVVTSDDFGGAEGIGSILNDYYEREIAELSPAEQEAARRFIEEGLIVNGRRVGVPEGAESARFGIGSELLAKLLNSRLLRAEVIHLGKIYELSHDTLVEPVLRSYERRRQEEERRRVERQLEEERARLEDLARKRTRARMFAIAGFTLFGLALVGGIFSLVNYNKAQKALNKAETTALATKAWSVYREDHTLAFRLAQAAYQFDTTNEETLQTLRNIVNEPTTTFYKTVFSGHEFEVTALAFSPDGQWIASGSLDSRIFIWDKNGRTQKQFSTDVPGGDRQSGSVCAIAFSPDGKKLYSAEVNGKVKVWDLNGDSVLLEFRSHRKTVTDLALSQDGMLLATCSQDSTARLWDTKGSLLQTFKGHNGGLNAVSFSPDNQRIATGGEDASARIWQKNGVCQTVISLQNADVNSVQFSPDGRTLALGCSDNSARLFSTEGRQLNTLSGHVAEVDEVLFSPDGKYLLTASNDHTAKLWNISGEEILRLVGHTEKVTSAAFSPDSRWIVTGGFDFKALVWNLDFNLRNKNNRHTDYVNKVKVSPDGSFLISGSKDNTVKKWDFEGNLLADMRGHTSGVTSVDISPDGQLFLSTSNDKNARLWSSDGQLRNVMKESKSDVIQAVFAPNGQVFATGDLTGNVALWQLPDCRLLHSWQASRNKIIQSLAFSPDGQRLYSAGSDGFIRAWTLEGDSLWASNNGKQIWSIAVSPDGKYIASAANEVAVRLWDSEGRLIKKCFDHLMANYHVVWSPDGHKFASSGWDRTAKIWDTNGNCLQTLNHPDGVYGSAFTPDNQRLVTACRDKIIRTWDVNTGQLLNTIGSRLDVSHFLTSGEIAPLESIAFNWEKYDITPGLAARIYKDNPQTLTRQGIQYLTKGNESIGNYDDGLQQLAEAERIFL
ncbi:MAG TPA: hypothetical protein PK228_17470, partial [Saprospiraceae bacterium]|nr:hypothetical protein [Saprospiraceae bacterium]